MFTTELPSEMQCLNEKLNIYSEMHSLGWTPENPQGLCTFPDCQDNGIVESSKHVATLRPEERPVGYIHTKFQEFTVFSVRNFNNLLFS